MINRLGRIWEEIWFAPQSPLPMSVYRILYGLLATFNLILLYPNLSTYFGPNAIVSWETASQYMDPAAFCLLSYMPSSGQCLTAFFVVAFIAAISLAFGLFTRLSAFVLLVCLISFDNRCPVIMNSGDNLLRLGAYFLMLSNAGKALSLDCLLKRRPGSTLLGQPASPWAQRLLQFQVVLVYFFAFWSKAIGELWVNGMAVYYVLHLNEFMRLSVGPIFENLWLCRILTWYALMAEFSMFTLIWFRKLRYAVLASVAIMHIGIELTMNIPIFEWLMISSLVVFIDPEDINKVLRIFAKRLRQSASN